MHIRCSHHDRGRGDFHDHSEARPPGTGHSEGVSIQGEQDYTQRLEPPDKLHPHSVNNLLYKVTGVQRGVALRSANVAVHRVTPFHCTQFDGYAEPSILGEL